MYYRPLSDIPEESAKGAISWKMARGSAESARCTLCCIGEIGGRQLHVNSEEPKKKCKALIELNTNVV